MSGGSGRVVCDCVVEGACPRRAGRPRTAYAVGGEVNLVGDTDPTTQQRISFESFISRG